MGQSALKNGKLGASRARELRVRSAGPAARVEKSKQTRIPTAKIALKNNPNDDVMMDPGRIARGSDESYDSSMAIQFSCEACHQPIEVDEEWAGRPVRCPYCQSAVTAPDVSTLEAPLPSSEDGPSPTAEAGPMPCESAPGMAVPAWRPNPADSNPAAVTAMVLACLLILLSIATVALMWVYREDFRRFEEVYTRLVEDEGMSFFEAQRRAALEMNTGGGFPPGMMFASLTQLSALGVWVATLIAAAVGLRRPQKRSMALGAIIIALIAPIICCVGTLPTALG